MRIEDHIYKKEVEEHQGKNIWLFSKPSWPHLWPSP